MCASCTLCPHGSPLGTLSCTETGLYPQVTVKSEPSLPTPCKTKIWDKKILSSCEFQIKTRGKWQPGVHMSSMTLFFSVSCKINERRNFHFYTAWYKLLESSRWSLPRQQYKGWGVCKTYEGNIFIYFPHIFLHAHREAHVARVLVLLNRKILKVLVSSGHTATQMKHHPQSTGPD